MSFGGIAGLFLGVSLLSVAELGYYVLRLIYAIYSYVYYRKNQPSTVKTPPPSEDIKKFTVPTITDNITKIEHNGFVWLK